MIPILRPKNFISSNRSRPMASQICRLESFKRGIPEESNVWPMTDPWDERYIYRHLWLILMEN